MMWKHFNVIFENNNTKNISVLNDYRTGCRTAIEQNMDSLMHVLSELTTAEKVNCRLVCKSWRTAVDKLFSGQRGLKIMFNNSKGFDYSNWELRAEERMTFVGSLNTYKMSKQIRFQLLHQMMSNFPSLQTLVLQDIPLNDIMILVITNTCRQLSSLSLISCIERDYYSNNYINNNNMDSVCDQITSYGWKLLINSYGHTLKQLTIRNSSLNDDDCETLLLGFPSLTELDLTDNEHLNGRALRLLGSECVSLSVGSLSTDRVWIQTILQSLSQSKPRLKRLQLRGGINQQLSAICALNSVEELSLAFFCPQDQEFDTLCPISQLANLNKLSLRQERCYDEPSAISSHSLAAIANGCQKLTELVISGEYGCKLRLNDTDIKHLVNKCQRLQSIHLTVGKRY